MIVTASFFYFFKKRKTPHMHRHFISSTHAELFLAIKLHTQKKVEYLSSLPNEMVKTPAKGTALQSYDF